MTLRLPARSAWVFFLVGLVSGTGCLFGRSAQPPVVAPPPPEPEPARTAALVLRGTEDMNHQNAVVARVYGLRARTALDQVALEDLWPDDEAALRGELVWREELRLYPGETRRLDLELAAEVTHVAVAVNLREATERSWLHVFGAGELLAGGAVVIITADRVGVSEE